ncbi:MAG: NAD-dependent epimerase/dehydratase family protein [Acidimicrobiia bacterium]
MLSDEKILITGVSGMVAKPLAHMLAKNNEVWGIARFADSREIEDWNPKTFSAPADRGLTSREELTAAGVTTRAIDIGDGDFSDLPDDFTYLLHLSWMRADLVHLEQALRTNVEGPGLLLQHCRKAKAALVMSGMGIYSPNEDPYHAYSETDPIGRGSTAYAPTSPASKSGVEAVARYCARAFDLPVVITRLNTFVGDRLSFPGMTVTEVLAGRDVTAPSDPNLHTPIHADDMAWQLEPLLDAASVPATITNWCGDEDMTVQQWVSVASEVSGHPGTVNVVKVPGAPAGTKSDPTRRRSITGPCKVDVHARFKELAIDMSKGAS